MEKSKEPIRLRQRETPNGLTSLYLDIYLNGKRSYEYLRLYLVPEKTREDKKKNKETLQLAEAIKAKRVVELRNGEFGFKSDYADDTLFFDYYEKLCEMRFHSPDNKSNWRNWRSCLKHLEKYEPNRKITFSEITTAWVQGFKEYLEHEACAFGSDYRERTKGNQLSHNTMRSYFNKLRACINQALNERIIRINPIRGVENFKAEEGKRMYLTIDEVRLLAVTECEYPRIKRIFLFSCLTGLRRSDILKMTWAEVQEQSGFTRIIFRQKKTGGQEYLDITPQAADLMGERGNPNEHVFTDIHSPSCTNEALRRWVLKAGIKKEITFHCARHTFAVMMLDLGTDIYTVSKLLGHRDLNTTQIYAKVLDKNKQAAVSNIPTILPPMTEKRKGDK